MSTISTQNLQPMSTERMLSYSYALLNYQWFTIYASCDELKLINKLETYLQETEDITREQWTQLKDDCLILVGSEIASTLSKICSAWRTPDIALSCFRDAAEKHVKVCGENSKQYAAQRLQDMFLQYSGEQ